STFMPIILGSNKTTVSVATGQNDFYPLYLLIGNVHNSVQHVHSDAVMLIGFLAMPKNKSQSYPEHANTKEFCQFCHQLFHSSLLMILQS
ncbi:hypothetical protein PAXRUDRAFT_89739, partial [Paxillus rubicundulus Ve08.2h10]